MHFLIILIKTVITKLLLPNKSSPKFRTIIIKMEGFSLLDIKT